MPSIARTARRKVGLLASLLAALPAVVGCDARPQALGMAECGGADGGVSYAQGIGPLLQSNCESCHGATVAEANYRVDTYQNAIARRPDGTPRVAAGNSNSPMLQAARGTLPGGHVAIPQAQLTELQTWVVDCALKPKPYTVHINGWMDVGNASQFHGKVLRQSVYDLSGCQACHGQDLSGGTAGVACTSCHASAIGSCNTCHGSVVSAAPPLDLNYNSATSLITVGAHQTHVTDGGMHTGFPCQVCHKTPATPGEEGHYQSGGKLLPGPAPVIGANGAGGTFAWNSTAGTCTNGYCHSPFADASSSQINPIVWTAVGQNQAACGTCHGNPPAGHGPNTQCDTCHRPTFNNGQPSTPLHANGAVNLAAPIGSCVGCHGNGDIPAPPIDLHGNASESVQTVGAHREHLQALHRVSAPVPCNECHLVPTEIHSPGHIDHAPPAIVFPPGTGTLARTDGVDAGYNFSTATCTVYCHGSGTRLSKDTSIGLNHAPIFNGGTSQAACGTCHGIPTKIPGTSHHAGVSSITQCAGCHPTTVEPSGSIIVGADGGSTHVNGVVNVGL